MWLLSRPHLVDTLHFLEGAFPLTAKPPLLPKDLILLLVWSSMGGPGTVLLTNW